MDWLLNSKFRTRLAPGMDLRTRMYHPPGIVSLTDEIEMRPFYISRDSRRERHPCLFQRTT